MAKRIRAPFVRAGLVAHLDTIRLTEYDDDGFLGFQIDADGERVDGAPELEPQVAPFEALHSYGFLSRPLDPTVDGGGQLNGGAISLTLWEGARAYSMALHDSRVVPALARCKPGESVQYGPKNNFVRCHDDGRISMMCTDDGTENGKTIQAELGPDGFTVAGPWGAARVNAHGFWYRHASGARFELGGIAGLPAPLNAVRSSGRIDTDIFTLKSICSFGNGASQPAAKATATLAVLTPTVTALQACAAALTALGAIPANSAAAPAITAAATAVAAAVIALGAGQVAIPAGSVSVA